MQEINLKVSVEEANLILDALGNQPFKQVFALIGKIQSQAETQLGSNGELAKEGKEKDETT